MKKLFLMLMALIGITGCREGIILIDNIPITISKPSVEGAGELVEILFEGEPENIELTEILPPEVQLNVEKMIATDFSLIDIIVPPGTGATRLEINLKVEGGYEQVMNVKNPLFRYPFMAGQGEEATLHCEHHIEGEEISGIVAKVLIDRPFAKISMVPSFCVSQKEDIILWKAPVLISTVVPVNTVKFTILMVNVLQLYPREFFKGCQIEYTTATDLFTNETVTEVTVENIAISLPAPLAPPKMDLLTNLSREFNIRISPDGTIHASKDDTFWIITVPMWQNTTMHNKLTTWGKIKK